MCTFLQTMGCNAYMYLVAVSLCLALLLWSSEGGAAIDATADAADDGVRDASSLGTRIHSLETTDPKRGHPDMNSLVFGRRGQWMTRKKNDLHDEEDDDGLDGICRSVVAYCSKLHSSDISQKMTPS